MGAKVGEFSPNWQSKSSTVMVNDLEEAVKVYELLLKDGAVDVYILEMKKIKHSTQEEK